MDITTSKHLDVDSNLAIKQGMNMDVYTTILDNLKSKSIKVETQGLADDVIRSLLNSGNKQLATAIEQAAQNFKIIEKEFPELIKLPELEQISRIQAGFVNFYLPETVNPYIALSACGPWVVTSCGAVVHDSGGYGMLGLGHTPEKILNCLAEKQPMANIMTAHFEQLRFVNKLEKEIGHTRTNQRDLYSKFICMNSGSEAVTVAARITDVCAKISTDKNGRHENKIVKVLAIKGGFHGRTDRPSQFSDSSLAKYRKLLKSFSERDNLVTVQPNNIAELEQAFEKAEKENIFFEAMIMEPVMGEGDPGLAVTPEFYTRARELTEKTGTLLIVDSIQAGLRAQGVLSIVDYPGFRNLPCPDLETYSKALNAGQYPFSVLALSPKAAEYYIPGIYGNTMTTNPRALKVASAVLDNMSDSLRENIIDKGKLFISKFNQLQAEFPQLIKYVQGTGLLFSMEIRPDIKVVGFGGLEETLRKKGIGVIHGGENSLRFTPHFEISEQEVDLIVDNLRDTFNNLYKS